MITLYRGLTKPREEGNNKNSIGTPCGYSCWTNNISLAREYAGVDGFIYTIELPRLLEGNDIFDCEGDRHLYYDNDTDAGINSVNGQEYLVYEDHEEFSNYTIREVK